MKFMKVRNLLLGACFALGLLACATTPSLFVLRPAFYQTDAFRVDYRIGARVYYISIMNRTLDFISVDPSRCSLVSVTGQSHRLKLAATDTNIPPGASVVLSGSDEVIAHIDIDAPFSAEGQKGDSFAGEESFLKKYKGSQIRLFLALTLKAQEKLVEIPLEIVDVRTRPSARDILDSTE
jgi:hypothetical protein